MKPTPRHTVMDKIASGSVFSFGHINAPEMITFVKHSNAYARCLGGLPRVFPHCNPVKSLPDAEVTFWGTEAQLKDDAEFLAWMEASSLKFSPKNKPHA